MPLPPSPAGLRLAPPGDAALHGGTGAISGGTGAISGGADAISFPARSKQVLEDGVLRGRLVLGLYGDDAPKTAAQFRSFMTGDRGPSFASALFYKHNPGRWLEGGRISGLNPAPELGPDAWDWGGKVRAPLRAAPRAPPPLLASSCPGSSATPPPLALRARGVERGPRAAAQVLALRPVLEANALRHDAPLLLTHRKLSPGPDFAVTLAPAPELDGDSTVVPQPTPWRIQKSRLPF
jgi:hypothetical protein